MQWSKKTGVMLERKIFCDECGRFYLKKSIIDRAKENQVYKCEIGSVANDGKVINETQYCTSLEPVHCVDFQNSET